MTDRARVPFALIGVFLLVVSGTVAVSQHHPVVSEPAVDREMDRLTAETQSALRSAVHRAARDAAATPVVRPANTTAGRAINETASFRDALRLRIYLAARSNLARLDTSRRGVDRAASLPPIADPTDEDAVRAAIERVSLARAGPDDARLGVRIEGLTVAATRGTGLGGERQFSPSFVVDTPILAVHDRVEGFEERLNRHVARPGLAQRVSAVLYPVAWVRGFAQYRGAPIENVVANRHVAVATNGALLGEQARAFGASDPVGRWVYAGTLAEVGVQDLAATTGSPALDRLASAANRSADLAWTAGEGAQAIREGGAPAGGSGANRSADGHLRVLAPSDGAPSPTDNTTERVGRAADRAFLDALDELDGTIAETYAPAVRVRATVRTLDSEVERRHSPGGGWELVDEDVSYATSVRDGDGAVPASADGYHRFAGHTRTVEVTKRTSRQYEKPDNSTGWTTRVVRTNRSVGLVVEGNHFVGPAPAGSIASVHERGGPLAGPNLADARERIQTHVERNRGGVEALAARAAIGRLDTDPQSVQAARPEGIAAWARPDLPELRRAVRNVSVTVPQGEVATFQQNVPKLLAERLRDRRAELVGAPATYGSVAERARVGVRADFVDRTLARLDERADQVDAAADRLDDALPSTPGPASDLLADGYVTNPIGALLDRDDGPQMTIDAAPAYLPTAAVDHTDVPALPPNRTEHPLVVRNLNAVSIPSTGVVEGLLGLLTGPAKASLRTAAQVARTAAPVDEIEGRAVDSVETLTDEIKANVGALRASIDEQLAARGLGSDGERSAVLDAALARYNDSSSQAIALANGSGATAVHAEALEHWPDELDNETARDRLAVEIDLAVVEALEANGPRPRLSTVNATAEQVRSELEAEAGRAVADAADRGLDAAEERATAGVDAADDRVQGHIENAADAVQGRIDHAVNRTEERAIQAIEDGEQRATEAIEKRVRRQTAALAARLPSGVPLVPAPGMWYATVNAWHVQVRGSYARFSVRVPRGSPDRLPTATTYVRENGTATLDVNGDGEPTRLGHNRRLTFAADTVIGVAVPPGAQGVGDVDERDERSPGWPDPGPANGTASDGPVGADERTGDGASIAGK